LSVSPGHFFDKGIVASTSVPDGLSWTTL